MAVLKIETEFDNQFRGRLVGSRGEAPLGASAGGLAPYDLLLGALASCLYATFLDIAEKKRLTHAGATIEVTGEKRSEVPTTLAWVTVRLTIRQASDQAGLRAAAELAGKYCSIYQTLSGVARMTTEVEFA